jgi:hypothetical protein
MQRCADACVIVVDAGALRRRQLRQRYAGDDAAFDVIHHVERSADDRRVFAQQSRGRHRHVGAWQRAQDPVLALDQVRRRQQLARRLLPQHELLGRRLDQERGIGLTALELPQLRRTGEIVQLRLQIAPQRLLVETMLRQDVDDGDIRALRLGC